MIYGIYIIEKETGNCIYSYRDPGIKVNDTLLSGLIYAINMISVYVSGCSVKEIITENMKMIIELNKRVIIAVYADIYDNSNILRQLANDILNKYSEVQRSGSSISEIKDIISLEIDSYNLILALM